MLIYPLLLHLCLLKELVSEYKKNPQIVELILSESKKIIRMEKGIIIVETKNGFICANAGIDESNVKNGFATLLPINSDYSAKKNKQSNLKDLWKRDCCDNF